MAPRVCGTILLLVGVLPGVLLYVAMRRPLRVFAREWIEALRSVWWGPVTP